MPFLPPLHLRRTQPLPPSNQSGLKRDGTLAGGAFRTQEKQDRASWLRPSLQVARPSRGRSPLLNWCLCFTKLFDHTRKTKRDETVEVYAHYIPPEQNKKHVQLRAKNSNKKASPNTPQVLWPHHGPLCPSSCHPEAQHPLHSRSACNHRDRKASTQPPRQLPASSHLLRCHPHLLSFGDAHINAMEPPKEAPPALDDEMR